MEPRVAFTFCSKWNHANGRTLARGLEVLCLKKKKNAHTYVSFSTKRIYSKSQQSCSQEILFSFHSTLTSAKNRHVFGCGRRATTCTSCFVSPSISTLLCTSLRNLCYCRCPWPGGLEIKTKETERQLRHSKGEQPQHMYSPSCRNIDTYMIYTYIYAYVYVCMYVCCVYLYLCIY
jgi:hypothetical protein